ncbi:MAG: chorismate-binding protein [Thermoplasmata archaeon]
MADRSSTRGAGSAVELAPFVLSTPFPSLHRTLARRAPGTCLLETLGSPGVSILVWNPAATIRLAAGRVHVEARPGVELPTPPTNGARLPTYLEAVLDRYRTAASPGAPAPLPFLGGLVGIVGYEWAAAQEGPDRPRAQGVPDLWFGLYDRALVQLTGGSAWLLSVPSIRGAGLPEVRRELFDAQRAATIPTAGSRPRSASRVVSDFPREAFETAVRDVRRRIRSGSVYQVNLAQRMRASGVDPWALYESLRVRNPSPFSGLVVTGDFTLVSASPERVLRVDPDGRGGRTAVTRPIAGTRPRAAGTQDVRNERSLRASPKERAEHTMLVDLGRNDLGRVCSMGSVEVDEWFTVERYSHVMHLVSNVRGRLRPDAGVAELFRALLPGGSVTGTPKIRATEIIAELEPVPRGAYTGSLAYLSLGGEIDASLLIRSAFFPHGGREAHVYAGSGIVHASDPAREWNETRHKAAVLLEAIGGESPRGFPWAAPRRSRSWIPPLPRHAHPGRRVLLIDNYDSFTHNLAQYLAALGAEVTVVRNDATSLRGLRARAPTHVVLSPGPGRPSEAGITEGAVRAFEGTPILGVCLGHQSIIEAYGGEVGEAPIPYHGKSSQVYRVLDLGERDILAGLPTPADVARYHSLVARRVPASLRVTARTVDGLVMAVQHDTFPTYGVQFHPESILTEGGMEILDRFLAVPPASRPEAR